MVAARLVAAGATVELVCGVQLVHAREDRDEFLRRRRIVESLVRRRERAREIERRVLRHRGAPRRLVARLVARARLAADVGAALEDGLLTAEACAHDAALAAEDVEQSRLGLAVFELGDGVGEIGTPVGADDVAAEKILGETRRLEHAARDGEERPEAAARRVEIVAGRPGEGDAAPLQHGAQLHVGEGDVDLGLGRPSSASPFLAMQGPTKTTLVPSPYMRCSTRAVASMGETMGARWSSRSGWYLRR